ncbi:MAG: oligopeptide/dipeptide ABC transporter ATP-binding protein [Acholeplasmataceae bacterium]
MKKVKLSVKNLTVSFRTNQGMVRAVRGVSFDLYEGETLAIVGESGSGKSVSSRAIMGILAGNSVTDKGSIFYEGQDLVKIAEEDFHKIRGDKIGMIFQDPMSSLNPIMKIGKQITEGMIINGKRMKNKYKSLIHATRIRVSNLKLAIRTARETFEENVKDLDKNSSDYAAFKRQLEEEIKGYRAELKEARAERKVNKKEAKATIKAEWEAHKADYAFKIKQVKDSVKNASSERKKEARHEIAELQEELRRIYKVTKREATERAITIMDEVGIPEPHKRLKQYPFQFSGGMRQRIVIAIALTANPDILICDEPTTALDVTIQAQILELIKQLKVERNLSVIFITHDLGVVANMADRVAVMYAGKIVELGTADEVFYEPKHPYTWALLSSMPDLDSKERLTAIPGTPPNMLFPPVGDAFAERSKYAMKIDFEKEPPLFKVSDTHYAASWLLHPDAPKVEMPEVIKRRIARLKNTTNEVIA